MMNCDGTAARGDITLREIWNPILLLPPMRLSDSPDWHGHLPFGMWLVWACEPRIVVELGVLKGDSYCAFCQATKYLKLPAKCFGIDTWEGDPHTGRYGEEIFSALRKHHDPEYGEFSTLLRATFDNSLGHFADRSIDLLHIDGFHSYKAVRHDFESWLPKLSDRAIVLFHDTAVIQLNFGVWRYWAQVCRRYPNFSFYHSNGLGVLAVGKEIPLGIRPLFAGSRAEKASFRHLFENLGALIGRDHRPAMSEPNGAALEALWRDLAEDKCKVTPYSHARQYQRYLGKFLSHGESAIRHLIKPSFKKLAGLSHHGRSAKK